MPDTAQPFEAPTLFPLPPAVAPDIIDRIGHLVAGGECGPYHLLVVAAASRIAARQAVDILRAMSDSIPAGRVLERDLDAMTQEVIAAISASQDAEALDFSDLHDDVAGEICFLLSNISANPLDCWPESSALRDVMKAAVASLPRHHARLMEVISRHSRHAAPGADDGPSL